MISPDTAKPATARGGEPASNVEQLGGELNLENMLSDDNSQVETALGAAFREAARRKAVLQDVKRTIATAKIAEFEHQCYRLGDIIKTKLLSPPVAADILLDAAVSNGLVHEHGDDVIQQIMAEGLSS